MSLSLNKRGMLSILVYNDFVIGHQYFLTYFRLVIKPWDCLTPFVIHRQSWHVQSSMAVCFLFWHPWHPTIHTWIPIFSNDWLSAWSLVLCHGVHASVWWHSPHAHLRWRMPCTSCFLEFCWAYPRSLQQSILLFLSWNSYQVSVHFLLLFPVVFRDVNDPLQCIRETLIFTLLRTRVTQIWFMGFLQP